VAGGAFAMTLLVLDIRVSGILVQLNYALAPNFRRPLRA
jgi:hypothetical protein